MHKEIDITRNIRIIEFLKSELLTSVASLFEMLLKGTKLTKEALQDVLANIILVAYILAKRFGINYNDIDTRVMEKIKIGKLEEHETEKWYGDLTDLSEFIKRHK